MSYMYYTKPIAYTTNPNLANTLTLFYPHIISKEFVKFYRSYSKLKLSKLSYI